MKTPEEERRNTAVGDKSLVLTASTFESQELKRDTSVFNALFGVYRALFPSFTAIRLPEVHHVYPRDL